MRYCAFSAADILLPKDISNPAFAEKWAVIACDQFTSEPEYWEAVEKYVADAPSTLRLILPEVFLGGDTAERLRGIADCMNAYRKSVLQTHPDSMLYVRRTQPDGRVRCGVVGKIDLEAYSYAAGEKSAVRATEGTVLSRIPPRVAVRRAASMELPHVLILIDDPDKSVIEPLASFADGKNPVYDFELMQAGGHLTGYFLPEAEQARVIHALQALDRGGDSIRFAVGDGNHSLASAKARYMELKAEIGDRALSHPLRYALCEIENLYDDALTFEPIYRLVHTDDIAGLLQSLTAYGQHCAEGTQTVTAIFGKEQRRIALGAGTHTLTVGTLQNFLDAYIAEHPQTGIDYIHGLHSVQKLAESENTIGFAFDGMRKEELFRAVESCGALPRKTFSMGEARDKRYYLECREITD